MFTKEFANDIERLKRIKENLSRDISDFFEVSERLAVDGAVAKTSRQKLKSLRHIFEGVNTLLQEPEKGCFGEITVTL